MTTKEKAIWLKIDALEAQLLKIQKEKNRE